MQSIKEDTKKLVKRFIEVHKALIVGAKLELIDQYCPERPLAPIIQLQGATTCEKIVLDCVSSRTFDTYLPEKFGEPLKELSVIGYTSNFSELQKLDYVFWSCLQNKTLAHIEGTNKCIEYPITWFNLDTIGEEFKEHKVAHLLFIKLDIECKSPRNPFASDENSGLNPYNAHYKEVDFSSQYTSTEILEHIKEYEPDFKGYHILVTLEEGTMYPYLITAESRKYKKFE